MLDGVPRMRERPIEDLVNGLRQLGVDVECPSGTGCPPVHLKARGLPCGEVSLQSKLLLQLAPCRGPRQQSATILMWSAPAGQDALLCTSKPEAYRVVR